MGDDEWSVGNGWEILLGSGVHGSIQETERSGRRRGRAEVCIDRLLRREVGGIFIVG